ncbi:sterol desaturase family protein [Turneriella parva]|jgi:lathosterol oxidase|uniref:Fatty acid hydroxylase n=1 Tax=Turneriella parva (strain ATCC BAA-1111 / DSM 21527 / NCTC 11395 / H) TaxID=869212 RepID=I4BAV3_TURPD|nr:sterol desaturase family protein [Turneriella parva]AFM14410.1 fatty acid hydroxylase [Turneriella parva DSM 21527]
MPAICELSWQCAGQIALFQLKMNFVRYYPIAGLAFVIFWVWKKGYFQRFKIQQAFPRSERIRYEILQSAVTLIVFTLIGVATFAARKAGYLPGEIYRDAGKYGGWPYMIFTIVAVTVWHETWFYWMHRLVHRKRLYKHIHLVHHKSINPTPLAAYNFHAIEAFLEGIYLVIFTCLVPTQFWVLMGHTFYAMIMNIWWHLGYEFFPAAWASHPILRWINTSTHHNMHHAKFDGNYSLYFNFWDRIMGTNFPDYEKHYAEVTARRRQERADAAAAV